MFQAFRAQEKILYSDVSGNSVVSISDEFMLYARRFYYWIYLNQDCIDVSISATIFPIKDEIVLDYEPIYSETIDLNDVPANSPILYLLDLTICQKYILDKFLIKFEITASNPSGAKIIKITKTAG